MSVIEPIEGPAVASAFDERAYLAANPDVVAAVQRGEFRSGSEHFRCFGRTEQRPLRLRSINATDYIAANADVARAVAKGEFRDAHHHYCQSGWRENRVLVRRTLPLVAGQIRSRAFSTPGDPLTAISLRFSPDGNGAEGTLELRLFERGRSPAVPVRRTFVDLQHLYADECYDWLFAPLPGGPGNWRLEIELRELVAGKAPALVAQQYDGTGAALAAGLPMAPEQEEDAAFDVLTHLAPLVAGPPRGLSYSAVTRCNLNCTHCVSRVTRRRVRRLGEAGIARFLPFLRQSRLTDGVVSDYAGDPLFAEVNEGGVLDLLEQFDTDVGLTTNGNVMTPELAWRVTGPAYVHVCVSIDAARPATYAKIRRGGCGLDEVLDNVRLLVETRRRRRGARVPTIGLNLVLMRSNVGELCELVDLAQATGVDAVNGVHLIAMTDDMEAESLWHHRALYNEARARAVAYAEARGVPLQLPPPFLERVAAVGHRVCHDPWRAVSVLGNGDVQACCMPESVVGNLHEHTLEEIWNGPIYRELRARVNSDRPPEACQHCPMVRLPHNPTSFLYNRPRRAFRLFRDELAPAPSECAGSGAGE